MPRLNKKNEDEVVYLLEADDDMLRFRMTLISGTEITPEMYLSALEAFIDDYREKPESMFANMTVMDYPTN